MMIEFHSTKHGIVELSDQDFWFRVFSMMVMDVMVISIDGTSRMNPRISLMLSDFTKNTFRAARWKVVDFKL